ncbi:MAG: DUF1385 domain-containing protein, partial [Actinomycetota bacterium]|nr:DUF1385 domain-containing protein [Actinomycetota bacterium]
MASKPSIGGQAVMEGVMMRGPVSWAIACRKPDAEIVVEAYSISGPRRAWMKWPFVRGVYTLVESLSIGLKALKISGRYQLDEEDQAAADKGMGWGMGIGMVFFLAIFITLPAFISKVGGRKLGFESDLVQNLFEGGIRIAFFVGYILLISLIPDIKRVFQYHGAEHKTIYAYENDEPLEPEVVDKYTTLHVRCGTNFLFIIMFLTIIGHLIADLMLPANIPLRLAARVLMIPLLAGISYEVIRAAGKNDHSVVFRIASMPGLAMQKITTRKPDHEQIEVAIKAMEAVIAREALTEPSRETVQVKTVETQPSPLLQPEP